MAGGFLNPAILTTLDLDFNAGSCVAGSKSSLPGVMDEPVQFWQTGDHQEACGLCARARLDVSVVLSLAVLLTTLSHTVVSSLVTVTCSHMTFSPRLHWCPLLVFRVHALYLVLLVAFVRRLCLGCLHAVFVVVVRWWFGYVTVQGLCGGCMWYHGLLGSDHTDRNSWKHWPEASGGTKALNLGSRTVHGWAFFRRYCRRESGTGTVFTKGARRNESWSVGRSHFYLS